MKAFSSYRVRKAAFTSYVISLSRARPASAGQDSWERDQSRRVDTRSAVALQRSGRAADARRYRIRGEIAAVGEGVTGWRVGDRVMGRGPGCYSEYTTRISAR